MWKIKAGALQLTLFISVVIALLLVAFVLLLHTHKRFDLASNHVIETIKNAEDGISYFLFDDIPTNDNERIEDNNNPNKSLTLQKKQWGLFDMIISESIIKNKQFQKMALVGGFQSNSKKAALYVKDNNKPLVLVGNTKIQGDVYVSRSGVKTGNIAGQSYYGEQLIYGSTNIITSFPRLLSENLEGLKNIQDRLASIEPNQFLDVSKESQHQNSFSQPTQYVFSNTEIRLSDITLVGHIVVKSSSKIVIYASSTLKDIILVAPVIEIENGVSGNFQAIASKKIEVGQNCNLEYPSALVLNEARSSEDLKQDSNIIVENNSAISGAVVYLGHPKRNNTKTQVVINEKTVVRGEVYCNQNLELRGAVNGSVYTANFMANQKGSIYQNHIYNGVISVNDLPREYVGLPINHNKKGVMKWLY